MNLRLILLLILSASLSLATLSCKKDDAPTAPDDPEPTQFRHAFFPMAVGNRWTYVDSTFFRADTMVGTHTVTIAGYHEDSLESGGNSSPIPATIRIRSS